MPKVRQTAAEVTVGLAGWALVPASGYALFLLCQRVRGLVLLLLGVGVFLLSLLVAALVARKDGSSGGGVS
ncbi:MAG: hypothetical protein NTU41_05385 [Chloroflexi bacterium]|nr:hypothetical protein [Chloroflexota bacterium]